MCRDAATEVVALNFGVLGDIADLITRAKCYVNRFRGFRVLPPPILPFSIDFAGLPYNSVTVLHCDSLHSSGIQVFFSNFA